MNAQEHKDEQVKFGRTISAARKKRGWSQIELAEQADVSRPTIARAERGDDVTTANFAKIAQALGLTLELKEQE
jgi:transcriptional regulator with XRE-family HTH domain